MSSMEGPVTGFVHPKDFLSISLSFAALYVAYLFAANIYNAFLGPLSKFPGPKLRAFSIVPAIRTVWTGTEAHEVPALHQQYGKVVRTGPNHLSFVGDAQTWKDVYGFQKHGQVAPAKDPTFYAQPMNRTPGLITADNPTHSRQRKVVSHAFSDRALKEQEPMLKHWAEKLNTKLAERAEKGEQTDMLKMLNCTTFDVMGDLTFAEPLHMLDNSEYVPWVKAIFGGLKAATLIRAVKQYSEASRAFIEEVIFKIPSLRGKQLQHLKYTEDRVDRRLSITPDRPDLWSRILEKSDGPDGLSKQEHYSIASLFMIAGTETTATALSGTLYHLLRNPQYMVELQKELHDSFSGMDDLKLEPLQKQRYLDAILHEGIRMYPPVPTSLPRIIPQGGAVIGGYFVPEGTCIGIHHLSTYRAESNFKEPYEFRPERWLGDEKFKDDNLDAWEPFSIGPRNCLGKNLAWHEMRLLLAALVLHFDFQLCDESAQWSDQKVFTLWEKPSLMCTLTPTKA